MTMKAHRRRYRVEYPSGSRLALRGDFAVIYFGEHGALPVIQTAREHIVLDPRAIVREHPDGRVIYHPARAPRETLAPGVREWLDDHLAWGAAA